MKDLIERQAAIDIVRSECRCGEQMDLIEELKALPSVQLEQPICKTKIQRPKSLGFDVIGGRRRDE